MVWRFFFRKGCLADAYANFAIKTTDTRLYIIRREITLLHCQINAVPTPNAILITMTVLHIAVTSNLCCRSLKYPIAAIGLGLLT
jgi:hypothetical protein